MKTYKINSAQVRVTTDLVPQVKQILTGVKHRTLDSGRGWSLVEMKDVPSDLYLSQILPLTRSVIEHRPKPQE